MSKRRQPYRKGDEIEFVYGFGASRRAITGVIESNSMKYSECFVKIPTGGN